jgi:hypothetical protein
MTRAMRALATLTEDATEFKRGKRLIAILLRVTWAFICAHRKTVSRVPVRLTIKIFREGFPIRLLRTICLSDYA